MAYLVFLNGGPEPIPYEHRNPDPRIVTVTEQVHEIVMPVGDGARGVWRPTETVETINAGGSVATVFEYAGEYEDWGRTP